MQLSRREFLKFSAALIEIDPNAIDGNLAYLLRQAGQGCPLDLAIYTQGYTVVSEPFVLSSFETGNTGGKPKCVYEFISRPSFDWNTYDGDICPNELPGAIRV